MEKDRDRDWDDDDGYMIGNCDHCAKKQVRVCLTDDPYTAELEPENENPESHYCRSCYQNRSDDI